MIHIVVYVICIDKNFPIYFINTSFVVEKYVKDT